MDCFRPITLKSGNFVPCGKCPACLANRQRDWTFRLEAEKDNSSFFFWLTLQYDESHVPWVDGKRAVKKEDCRYFFERIRKRFPDTKFKHFLVSEYGPHGTHRPHYHTLLFVRSSLGFNEQLSLKTEIADYIKLAWPFGHVQDVPFHNRVFGYVTKYCCKPELIGLDVPVPVFTLISQGIGKSFLDRVDSSQMVAKEDYRVSFSGTRYSLPRYYRQKLQPARPTEDLCSRASWFADNIEGVYPESSPDYQRELLYLKSLEQQWKDWYQFTLRHKQRLAEIDNLHEERLRKYEQRNGFGSYSKRIRAIQKHVEHNFINKLKQRENG